jgi:hypothetical protein
MSGVRVEYTPSGALLKHGGSGSAYANYGCRCDECKAANAARVQRRARERTSEEPAPDSHGKDSTYKNWGCRCEACIEAHRVTFAALKAKRND